MGIDARIIGSVGCVIILTLVCASMPGADTSVRHISANSVVVQDATAQVLIGGAPDTDMLHALTRSMPWFDRRIECIVVPSLAKASVAGLVSVLDRYSVGLVVLPHMNPADAESRTFIQQLIERHIPYRFAYYGQQLAVGDIHMRVIAPLGAVSTTVVRVDVVDLSFISAMPKGVSPDKLVALHVPKQAFAVSAPSFIAQETSMLEYLKGKWFMKCDNKTDLPFLQHYCIY